jgi:hypothetical protein
MSATISLRACRTTISQPLSTAVTWRHCLEAKEFTTMTEDEVREKAERRGLKLVRGMGSHDHAWYLVSKKHPGQHMSSDNIHHICGWIDSWPAAS